MRIENALNIANPVLHCFACQRKTCCLFCQFPIDRCRKIVEQIQLSKTSNWICGKGIYQYIFYVLYTHTNNNLKKRKILLQSILSSPRAESARAFTGRRNSHSGRGEAFLSRQPNFFTETAVTPERKVEKWFPRWEINRHAEG